MIAALRLFRLARRRTRSVLTPLPATTERALGQLPRPAARRITLALTAAALAVPPAAAQRVPSADNTAYARAIAAGYKALTLCNGIFVAGRAPEQIERDELTGIYPEYDRIVPALRAEFFDQPRETPFVQVRWSPDMPPRVADYDILSGCWLRPIGSDLPKRTGMTQRLSGLTRPSGARSAAWPSGDTGIRPRPSPALRTALAHAFNGTSYGSGSNTIGVVVLRDGKVIAETYGPGWGPFTSNRTWSAAKSIAGTLVGIAVREGFANVADPAPIPEWAGLVGSNIRSSITLDNLLRMASGLHSGAAGNRTDAIYFGGTAVTEEATGWDVEARPGTRFRYANDDILLAMRSLRYSLGDLQYADYPFRTLFAPLGMTHTRAGTDWAGNYIMSSQVWSTARDLARLGQFWLQDGVWQGKRLLPEGWVKYMTTPSGPQPPDSSGSGPGYGATLWLFGPKQGLPAGSYAAQGNRGQYIMVVPSERLVVVRRGEDPGAARFDLARFTADVIAALR